MAAPRDVATSIAWSCPTCGRTYPPEFSVCPLDATPKGEGSKAGDPLITFDMDVVALKAKSLVTPVLLTNETGFEFKAAQIGVMVERGQPIGTVTATADIQAASTEPGTKSLVEATVALQHGTRVADVALDVHPGR
jgi:hypothetical protein